MGRESRAGRRCVPAKLRRRVRDLLNEQLFGTIWNRPGLPVKLRSLITMTALMALGRGPELRLHMRGALNLGIPPEEIKELIVHVSQYSGVPTAIEAIRAFAEVTTPPKPK